MQISHALWRVAHNSGRITFLEPVKPRLFVSCEDLRQPHLDFNMTAPQPIPSTEAVIAATQVWLEKAVIGLNLCPFAKAVHVKNQIRYLVSAASSQETLLEDLIDALNNLVTADATDVDTVLLIHPGVLNDFLDYNDFLDVADAALDDLGLSGQIQIASFHPHYQFAGTMPDDIENYTNRSPYPLLHLLREVSIERAVEAFPDAAEIFEKNMDTLRELGHSGWEKLAVSANTSLPDAP